MTQFYNKNSVIAAATIFTLAIIVASSTTANASATTTQQPPVTTITTKEATSNNVTNAALGRLFSYEEGTEANVNPINEKYSVMSYSGNRVIMPPNSTGVVINATEIGNLTVNIQANGLYMEQGEGFVVTDDGATAEEENATLTFVSLGTTNPNGTGSRTGVAFYNTNSTGQLAFLDNMIGIFQTKFSPEGSDFREWEWKGGTIPSETKLTNSSGK